MRDDVTTAPLLQYVHNSLVPYCIAACYGFLRALHSLTTPLSPSLPLPLPPSPPPPPSPTPPLSLSPTHSLPHSLTPPLNHCTTHTPKPPHPPTQPTPHTSKKNTETKKKHKNQEPTSTGKRRTKEKNQAIVHTRTTPHMPHSHTTPSLLISIIHYT